MDRVLASVAVLAVLTVAFPAPNRTSASRVSRPAAAAKRAAPRTPVPLSDRQQIQRWMRSLTLREQIAQLVIIPFYGEPLGLRSPQYREFQRFVRTVKVGGLIIINRPQYGTIRSAEPHAMAAFLNRMQKQAEIPLLVGGDFERGASMRVSETVKYPHAMAYAAAGDLSLTRHTGEATAREARALGVHWVFAPVADVNNNPDNPIINIRSFSENPAVVAEHVKAYIEGAHANPQGRVLVTVKHFPGHGDTAEDSHMGLARVTGDRARLDQMELVPFRAAIAAGVDSIMTAHLSVPAIEPQEIPATISPRVLTGLLREELGFRGLIVTDAMEMQGLAKQYSSGEASVRALEAGADVLLMPVKPEEAIQGVLQAVQQGRLSRKRIEQSLQRFLAAKIEVGLHRRPLVDVESIGDALNTPEDMEKAQEIADKAVTALKNEQNLLPLSNPESACVYVLAEGRYSPQGRRLMDEVMKRSPRTRIFWLEPGAPDVELADLIDRSKQCETNVVAAFVSVGAYRGNVALAGNYADFVRKLQETRTPMVFVALGNPYLLKYFPDVTAYLNTYSTAPTAEFAAVKALFGEITVRGRLPVTIPQVARYGEGLTIPARTPAVANRD